MPHALNVDNNMDHDDSEREDVPEANFEPLSQSSSVPPSPTGMQMATRRRKPHKTARSPTPAMPLREVAPTPMDYEQMQRDVLSVALSAASYIVDVLAIAFWLLKTSLGVPAFVVTLALLPTCIAANSSVLSSPVCSIPGISPNTFCPGATASGSSTTDKKPKSENFAQPFKLQDTEEGSEMVVRDLATRVRESNLRSRDTLAEALMEFVGCVEEFVEDAKVIMSYTEPETIILRSLEDAMDSLTKETQRAVLEVSASTAHLKRLQEHLLTIYEICVREGFALSDAHPELSSELLTILGGNRSARGKTTMPLTLLEEIVRYRKEVLTHVVGTLNALLVVAVEVEELQYTAMSAIVGDRMIAEVSIRIIGHGIERVRAVRQRARERQRALVDRLLASPSDVLDTQFD